MQVLFPETKTIFKDLKPVLDSNEEIHFRKEINKLCKGESKLLRVYALENILKMGYEDRIMDFWLMIKIKLS